MQSHNPSVRSFQTFDLFKSCLKTYLYGSPALYVVLQCYAYSQYRPRVKCGRADVRICGFFFDLKMTKPNYKPNNGPNSNSNPKQTLMLIQVHNFHPNPFQNPQIRTSTHLHFTSGRSSNCFAKKLKSTKM